MDKKDQANILRHLIESDKGLSIKDIVDLTNSSYFPVRDTLIRFINEGYVLQEGKSGRKLTYIFNKECGKTEQIKAYLELSKEADLLNVLGTSIIVGWKKSNKRPLQDWLKSFATNPKSMKNAMKQALMMPLIVAELYETAVDKKSTERIKQLKLDELKEALLKVEQTFNNQLMFLGELKKCGWLWNSTHLEKYLIEKPGIEPQAVVDCCNMIRDLYGNQEVMKESENN